MALGNPPNGGAESIFRDMSGGTVHQPAKQEVRDWGAWVEDGLATIDAAESLGSIIRMTGSAGTANDIIAEIAPAQAHIPQTFGQRVQVPWPATNTGPASLNGFVIKRRDGTNVAAGDLLGGTRLDLVVHNTDPIVYRLMGAVAVADINGLPARISDLETADAINQIDAAEALNAAMDAGSAAAVADSKAVIADGKAVAAQVALAAETTRAQGAEAVLDASRAANEGWALRRLGPNNAGLVLALIDRLRRSGWAIRHDSSMWLGDLLFERTRRNSLGLFWGLKDVSRRIAMAFDNFGGHWLGRLYYRPLGANSLDLWQAWGDRAGQVSLGLRRDGSVLLTTRDSNVWVQDGDAWALEGGEMVRLTETGSVLAVENIGNGSVRIAANLLGAPLQYVLDKTAPAVLRRLYASTAAYWMIPTTGQSLAEGAANAAITTTPVAPGVALKLGSSNTVGSATQTLGTSLTDLSEAVYETISSGAARKLVSKGLPSMRRLIYAGQAWGGKEIEEIWQGGSTGVFEKVIAQVQAAHAATSGSLIVPAVDLVEGEADGITADTDYHEDIEALRLQYQTAIQTITGQRDPVMLLTCQTSSVSGYRDSFAQRQTFRTPFLQALAAQTSPLIKLIGPKYFLTYVDHSHLDALSMRLLGEYYGKVQYRTLIEGLDWRPVQATAIAIDNDGIVLDYHAPVGALALDTTLVSDPGNYGFQMHLSGGVDIATVTQTGDRQITLTCSGNVPSGALLSYAHYNGTSGTSGRLTGARGCVRDSDADPSTWTGLPLHNYALSFEQTLTL